MKSKKLGELDEDIDCAYLGTQGYKILKRN